MHWAPFGQPGRWAAHRRAGSAPATSPPSALGPRESYPARATPDGRGERGGENGGTFGSAQ
eukprot:4124680-Pyramimonas_sp.AAC.1